MTTTPVIPAPPQRGDVLRLLERDGSIAPLDAALARLVRQLDPSADTALATVVALASRAVADGHSCLPIAQLADFVPADNAAAAALPDVTTVRAALAASPLVGAATDATRHELYFDGDNLYLGRFFHYEEAVADRLRRMLTTPFATLDAPRAKTILADYFRLTADHLDWQAVAVATGLMSRLTVITGGPGTGKTTTVRWLLASLLRLAADAGQPLPRIALAAPTGKAATRLAEALAAGRQDLHLPPALGAALPTTTSTVHRLLGSVPGSSRCHHRADRPLEADVVVVDEVSMVDLPLMAKLLDALPDTARLVLLGDRNQLASVEAGNVLAAICAAAGTGTVSTAHDAAITALTGATLTTARAVPAFADVVVELRDSHRFDAAGVLGQLADAIRRGDADAVLAALGDDGAATLDAADGDVAAEVVARHADGFAALALGSDPAQALAAAGAARVLTALRAGRSGCVALNQALETELRRRGHVAAGHAFYPGRLIMVTENAYGVDLFNGDTGIILDDGSGTRLVAWFPAAGGPRSLPLSALPAHESAFAITIHKSQGSEFDAVTVVLPHEASRILGRELLYTAVTRARQRVHVVATNAALQRAVTHTTRRYGGLAARLAASIGAR